MKKYKRIKKYFHFTTRSNSYKLIEICSKFYLHHFVLEKSLVPSLKRQRLLVISYTSV